MLRFLTAARIAGAVIVLAATFAFGFWLTGPSFPAGRTFVAVSLNGEPFTPAKSAMTHPMLEVRRVSFSVTFRAIASGYCNRSIADVMFVPPNVVIWPSATYFTAVNCAEELEARYFQALLTARRWRIEEGALILTNGTDTLRFLLTPD